jgi:hypothetical protein
VGTPFVVKIFSIALGLSDDLLPDIRLVSSHEENVTLTPDCNDKIGPLKTTATRFMGAKSWMLAQVQICYFTF